jgi:biopolymer transport protein ExbB
MKGTMPARIAAFALCAGAAFAQENYTTWGRVKTITINTSATGANTTEGTGNIPILVRLDSTQAEVFQQAKTGGADLRFRRVNGPHLAYYIASWDSAARKAEIWVSVDTIFANDANQFIRMYWQKADAPAASSDTAVFSASKGFVAAWNLGGATCPRANYVAGGPTALCTTGVPDGSFTGRSVAGVVGTADSLAGGTGAAGGEYFDVSPMPDFANGFTLSMWAKVTSTTNRSWMRFFDFGNGEAQENLFAGREGTTTTVRFDVLPTQTAISDGIALNQWRFYTFTVSGEDNINFLPSIMNAYMDGEPQATAETNLPVNERASSFLGKSNWAADAYFTGLMDEVHVSGVARSSAWARLSYLTQRPGANLLTFSESGPGASVLPAERARKLSFRRQGAGYAFDLPSAGSEARLTISDVSGRTVWSRKLGRGETSVVWNAGGAARGTYLARLEVSGAQGATAWEGVIAHTK